MLDLVREDCLGSVDEEERSLARWLGSGGADGPQHGLDRATPAVGLQLLLEGPGLEAPQDLCVGALSLTIAPGVGHRSVADLCSKVSTVGFEEVTSELRAVICVMRLGTPKRLTRPLMNLIAEPAGMVQTTSTSAHLVNLSMAT